jgi:tRNA U34 5-methylaminomethyl-2-thiouridine-forming methyltransferase MnmC
MLQTVITGDGSCSLYNPGAGEHYHSTFGAVTESMHVFIKNGIETINSNPIRIFEMGFGSGLNALLACLYAEEKQMPVFYNGIELYPLDFPLIRKLNYPELTNTDPELFQSLHLLPWSEEHQLTPNFSFRKVHTDLLSITTGENSCDLIFFDAFSPQSQPELWSFQIFKNLYESLTPGGVLVTYCVKGIVKKALRDCGFTVKVLPGPPGKRHMLRAVKN